jgi:hypothetical protein
MSIPDESRPGNPQGRVVRSARMAPVAQVAQAAPVAPPQNLEAEESALGAMMLSPGAIGAASGLLRRRPGRWDNLRTYVLFSLQRG